MTEHSAQDDSTAARRALILRLTAGAAAGAAFVYPVVLTFSQEWAQGAAGHRVDYSVASADTAGAQAPHVVALLQDQS